MYIPKSVLAEDVSSILVMWKKVTLPLQGIFLSLTTLSIFFFAFPPLIHCVPARAVLLNAKPVEAVDVRKVYIGRPYQQISKRKYSPPPPPPPPEDYYYEPSFSDSDSFSIMPEDAISRPKYSPPVYSQNSGFYTPPPPPPVTWRVPTLRRLYSPGSHSTLSSQSQLSSSVNLKHVPFIPSILMSETFVTEATVTSDYKVDSGKRETEISRSENRDHLHVNVTHSLKNNFTETNISHAPVPSDAIFKYHPPPFTVLGKNQSDGENIEYTVFRVPNLTKTDDQRDTVLSTTVVLFDSDVMLNDGPAPPMYDTTETPDPFDKDSSSTNTVYSIDDKVTLTPNVSVEVENSSMVPPVNSTKQYKFSSGAVAGIVIAVLTGITVVTSSVIYLLYRRYNGQCTSVVESKFNSDNCGYLDDSLRSSVYLNNHIELPKENSEEMTSLDNDSFLNSLETMTIQNYWADNTKNTKV